MATLLEGFREDALRMLTNAYKIGSVGCDGKDYDQNSSALQLSSRNVSSRTATFSIATRRRSVNVQMCFAAMYLNSETRKPLGFGSQNSAAPSVAKGSRQDEKLRRGLSRDAKRLSCDPCQGGASCAEGDRDHNDLGSLREGSRAFAQGREGRRLGESMENVQRAPRSV